MLSALDKKVSNSTDKRLDKRGHLKVDKRYFIIRAFMGHQKSRYVVIFDVLGGEWLGTFDTIEEAVTHASRCHEHNYATNEKLWGLDQHQMQKVFDESDAQRALAS